MKKLLIAVVIGLLLVLAVATTALADNGPHGAFAANTDACASCHRAHTAQSADGFLLASTDVYSLCTSCHNGDGAYTNVVDGVYGVDSAGAAVAGGTQGDQGQGLFGGGFVKAAINTVRSNVNGYDTTVLLPTPKAVTSHHIVDGVTAGTVWGSGDVNSAAYTADATTFGTLALECTSCHDPHGNAGKTGGINSGAPTSSYRILRFNPVGSNGYQVVSGGATNTGYFTSAGVTQTGLNGGVYVADVATKWYTLNTDYTIDPTVQAFRSRGTAGTNTPWWAYVNMRGDAAGRTYVYQRPAMQISGTYVAGVWTPTAYVPGTSYISCSPSINAGVGSIDGSCTYTATTNPAAGSVWNNTVPMGKLGYWCATCHDRYLAGSTGRTVSSTDSKYTFRHSTTSVACVNCHTAHGTTADMTLTNTNHPTASLTSGSILLKADNRQLCADCHGYDVNWQSGGLINPAP